MMVAIEIKNLTKIIKNKTILDNINLEINKGEITGFIGRNGSGKTMLFRAVCGLIHPTSGEIRIFNRTLGKDMSFPENIGAVIESAGFWDNMTGLENLTLLASIRKKVGDSEIRASLTALGLDPNDNRLYKKYSLGMKQRLAIAQSIMEKPDILVLDEPTNSLDTDGISIVRNLLMNLKRSGVAVLIASHNKEDIEILADKKYIIEEGKVRKGE